MFELILEGTAEMAALLGAKTVLLPMANWPRRAIPLVVFAIADAMPTRPVKLAALGRSVTLDVEGGKDSREGTEDSGEIRSRISSVRCTGRRRRCCSRR